ncbi:hypothetical protein PT277_02845 [Acetobacteraceae bacterium ESL0709]|nr:hypothetical protein [Acetobacteraceae bacterium ESL0709]
MPDGIEKQNLITADKFARSIMRRWIIQHWMSHNIRDAVPVTRIATSLIFLKNKPSPLIN